MNFKSLIKKVTEQLIRRVFNLFDRLIYQKKYIVFSSRAAKGYADNSKVLFEKFIAEEIDGVFYFTKSKKALKMISKK